MAAGTLLSPGHPLCVRMLTHYLLNGCPKGLSQYTDEETEAPRNLRRHPVAPVQGADPWFWVFVPIGGKCKLLGPPVVLTLRTRQQKVF